MEPKHLMQLAMVLEQGSITKAAEHLSVTQPTLTRNMATLEMQAGGALFTRSRFGVRSTSLGESLARDGRLVAATLQQARESIARHKLGLFNELRVGVGPLFGLALMPQVTPAFLAAFPHVALTITTARPQTLVEALLADKLDVVIAPQVYQQLPPGISRRVLMADSLGVFCSKSHPMARIRKTQISQLGTCDWINVGIPSPFQNPEQAFLQRNGIERPRTQIATINDAAILLQILRQGRHLAVLPRLPVALIDQQQTLCEIPLPSGPAPREVLVWTRDTTADQPAIQGLTALSMQALQARPSAPKRRRLQGS